MFAGLPRSAGAGGRATRCRACWLVGIAIRRRAGPAASRRRALAADACRCSSRPRSAWRAMVGLALPLFVVTMASQNLPGVAAISAPRAIACRSRRSSRSPASRRCCWRRSALRAEPGGDHRGDLHGPRGARRPGAGATSPRSRAGVIYCVHRPVRRGRDRLLAAFPRELVVAIAGLALLGTSAAALAAALKDEPHREAALITFLVTLSGVTPGRHRLGLLGRGGRRARAFCATVAARASQPDAVS